MNKVNASCPWHANRLSSSSKRRNKSLVVFPQPTNAKPSLLRSGIHIKGRANSIYRQESMAGRAILDDCSVNRPIRMPPSLIIQAFSHR
jgi:hypothetical protein